MDLKQIRAILKENKEVLRKAFGVMKIRIYGSFAKGRPNRERDLDIIVSLEKPLGINFVDSNKPDWTDLRSYLQRILGLKVDVASEWTARRSKLWDKIKGDLISVRT